MALVIISTLLVFGAAIFAMIKFRPKRTVKVRRGYEDETSAELLAVVAEAQNGEPSRAAPVVEQKPHEFKVGVKAPTIPTF
jgi:hypothetical protein